MDHVLCPACGSNDIETVEVSRAYEAPYGSSVNYSIRESSCRSCGERGDFECVNDEIVESAISRSNSDSVAEMLKSLGADGHTMASIERALELPARTLFRWKSPDAGYSAAGLALLRVVRTYPWVLEVANAKFDPQIASKELLKAALEHGCVLAASAGYSVVAVGTVGEEGAFAVNTHFQPRPLCTQARSSTPAEPRTFVA